MGGFKISTCTIERGGVLSLLQGVPENVEIGVFVYPKQGEGVTSLLLRDALQTTSKSDLPT